MKKLLLIMVIMIGLFSLKNIYGYEENEKIQEFKHALETENIEVLNKMLTL